MAGDFARRNHSRNQDCDRILGSWPAWSRPPRPDSSGPGTGRTWRVLHRNCRSGCRNRAGPRSTLGGIRSVSRHSRSGSCPLREVAAVSRSCIPARYRPYPVHGKAVKSVRWPRFSNRVPNRGTSHSRPRQAFAVAVLEAEANLPLSRRAMVRQIFDLAQSLDSHKRRSSA